MHAFLNPDRPSGSWCPVAFGYELVNCEMPRTFCDGVAFRGIWFPSFLPYGGQFSYQLHCQA